MKKLLITALLLLGTLGMAANAPALQFTLDSYSVSLRTTDPGLVLYWSPILATPAVANFEVGDTYSFKLFKIGTRETTVNWGEDTVNYPISVFFDFSSPEVNGTATGRTDGLFLLDIGRVRWDGPALFSFGGTGLFSIALSDVWFGTPGSADVWAKFTYEAAPVPEPATMLLLGSGLIGLAAYGRRKFKS